MTAAALVIAAFLVVCAICAVANNPRGESMSERHDRLDAEARSAANVAGYGRLGREELR